MNERLSLAGIREGAMNPPAGGAAGAEDFLWNQLLQAREDERQAELAPLREASNRALHRSGWYNVGSMLMPQDAGDVALSMAMGPGLGRAARGTLAALGGLTTQVGDAEGSVLTRAWRALNPGAMAGRQRAEIEQHLAEGLRVRDAVVDPTVQHYLDNMRNVLAPAREMGEDGAGRQLRMYEDPIAAARGETRPDWMLALNPQRELFNEEALGRLRAAAAGTPHEMRLPDALADRRTLAMYPELEDMRLIFDQNPHGAAGHFSPPDAGWLGAPGGSGQGAEIALNGAHIPAWDRGLQRAVIGEELQHAMQWADNRIGATVPDLQAQWQAMPDWQRQPWEDFYPSREPRGSVRHYRGYPIEWEGGLAGARAETRSSVPLWDRFTALPSEHYWNLFDPRRLP